MQQNEANLKAVEMFGRFGVAIEWTNKRGDYREFYVGIEDQTDKQIFLRGVSSKSFDEAFKEASKKICLGKCIHGLNNQCNQV